MDMAGAVLGVLVVIAVVTGMVMIGGRFRHEPRRPQRMRLGGLSEQVWSSA